jgi:RNA polymerase sigma factor (sigma-70 family)
MASEQCVPQWLERLQSGDSLAAQELWHLYFERLVRLARQRLPMRLRRVADEEDIALSAMKSFCRAIEAGRYPQIADRDDLWRVLVVITARKTLHLVRDQQRQKRGGRFQHNENESDGINQIVGREPSPEFAVEVAEELENLLERLEESDLKSLAVWKLEGYTSAEIAARLDCGVRTVERKLAYIRRLLESSLPR